MRNNALMYMSEMEKNLTVFERTLHKIHITFAQDASVSNFTWSGAAKSMYGCECFHFDTDIKDNEVIMTTPSLSTGLYKYQIFCKSRSNVEYLVLSGEISVRDKLCDCDQQPAIDGNESTAEVAVSPEVINVTVSLPGAEISGNYLAFEFLEDGNYNVTGDLSEMTDLSYMFHKRTNLASFNVDLSALTDGERMFYQCTNLASFNVDLSALTDGADMFYQCKKLTSFSVDLPKLTAASNMFGYCDNLTSFSSDLSALADAHGMFNGSKNLTSFSSDLSALITGASMFGMSTSTCTKLDLASVQNIADTINDLVAAGKTGRISIGIASELQSDDETAPINVALAAIRAKGWTVTELYA